MLTVGTAPSRVGTPLERRAAVENFASAARLLTASLHNMKCFHTMASVVNMKPSHTMASFVNIMCFHNQASVVTMQCFHTIARVVDI